MFRAAHPCAILVVPVVNHTVDVTAADYFLSTLPRVSRSRLPAGPYRPEHDKDASF